MRPIVAIAGGMMPLLILSNNAVAMSPAKVENCGWFIARGDGLVAQPDASLKPSDPAPLSKPPPHAKAAYCERDTLNAYVEDNRIIKLGLPLIIRSGSNEGVLEYFPGSPPHRVGDRHRCLPGSPPTNLNHWGSLIPFLEAHRTIILVRVQYAPLFPSPRATVLVLKSWKGSFSAGRVLQVGPPPGGVTVNMLCDPKKCPPDMYLFRPFGDKELFIMTDSETEPLTLWPESVSSGSESQALIRTADQAVQEVQELQDPQTDIARGPERQRVMLELKGCMAAAVDKMMRMDSRDCRSLNLRALLGIKRSELVWYWGPPTSCQRDPSQTEFSPPTGPDCPPEQTPIWTFGHPGNNLYCSSEGQTLLVGQKNNLRCMDLSWRGYGPTQFRDQLRSQCGTEGGAVSLYVHEEGGAVVGFAPPGREQQTLSERPLLYSDNLPQLTAVSCTADGFDLTTSIGLMHIRASDFDALRIAPRNLSEEYRRANGSPARIRALLNRHRGFMEQPAPSRMDHSAEQRARQDQSIKQSCNVVPLMACGTPLSKRWAAHTYYGYAENALVALKLIPKVPLGPGNFLLIQLPRGSEANSVSQDLAGRYHECLVKGNSIQIQPGNENGPIVQGLNTRFGDYVGNLSGSQAQYPPDVITTQRPLSVDMNGNFVTPCNMDSPGIFDYNSYQAALKAHQYTNPPPDGQINRRILLMPVGDCSAANSGGTADRSASIPIIGFACFFMLQKPIAQGNTALMPGQFVSCKH